VEVSGNLIVDFANPFAFYGNDWNIHDNTLVNCGAHRPGSAPATASSAQAPADPPRPVRIAW
jgi:hypothetical protein